jgi:hypothetical protein
MLTARPSESALAQRMLWGSLLTIATVGGSLALACATPFAALAALAALFLPRRDAFVLIGVNWLVNQVIGFGFLHYPPAWSTVLAGIELGVVCMACTAVALLVSASLRNVAVLPAVLAVFAVTFVSYEALNFVTSIGHHAGDFQPSVTLYILYLNGLAFAGLLLLQRLAELIGVAVPRGVTQRASTHIPAVS